MDRHNKLRNYHEPPLSSSSSRFALREFVAIVVTPVLLDDSLTNFDPSHHVRTLQTISELADTNQVFLLTCHPELLERVDTHTDSAQYWSLDDGQFNGPYSKPDDPCELLEPTWS